MFSSKIIDNSNNCNIIKHSLMDDLYPFTTDNTSVRYNNGSVAAVTYKEQPLLELVRGSVSNTEDNIWCPIFISNDNYIENKMLSSDGSYLNGNPNLSSGRIGIENFCSFRPEFKSWRTGTSPMSIDWILNSHNTSYAVYYGIMGWVKKRSKHYILGGKSEAIEKFPNGSRLINSSNPNIIYIKLSDEELWSLDGDNIILPDGGSFTFFDQTNDKRIKYVSSFNDNLFSLANFYNTEQYNSSNNSYSSVRVNLDDNIFSASNLSSLYTLWVPDGDFFAHYDSESDRIQSQRFAIPSKSYISQSLYKFYTSIYRILTLDEPRNTRLNLRKLRYYRKLAHTLSTSPFINEFSIMSLDTPSARQIIQQYVNSFQTSLNINSEISLLRETLIKLSTYFQKFFTNDPPNNSVASISLDTEQSPINLNNNIVRSRKQLFDKLYHKYGAELRLSSSDSIASKLNFDNTGIAITQVYSTYCNKTYRNREVRNSETITFGSSYIDINTTNGSIVLKQLPAGEPNIIPLADGAKPGYGMSSFFIPSLVDNGDIPPYNTIPADSGSYIYKTSTIIDSLSDNSSPGFIDFSKQEHAPDLKEKGIELVSIDIKEAEIRSYNEVGILEKGEIYYLEQNLISSWEQISGPPGTFESNFGLGTIGNVTKFYTGYTGKFVFRCTLSSPFGTYKKLKTVYVVDGRITVPDVDFNQQPNTLLGKYWDPSTSSWIYPPATPNIDEITPIQLNLDNLTVSTSKIKKIAINNISSVFWPISSDHTVREYIGNVGDRFITIIDQIYKLENDYRFVFQQQQPFVLNQRSNCSIQFSPGDTVIRINSIFLEKIRHNLDDKCSQCLSMYMPNIKARKSSIATGGSSGGTDSALNKSNVLNTIRTNKSPDLFDLVQYTYDPIRKLWNANKAYKSIDYPVISTDFAPKIKSYGGYSKNFIDTIGVSIPSHPSPPAQSLRGIVGTNNPVLPTITGFKLDYPNSQNSSQPKFCYQKALELTPTTGSIITFQKGVLHTSSGWIPSTSDRYRIHANRCGVLKFNPGARDSFAFVGPKITQIESAAINVLNNTIEPKIFSSAITLAMARYIQWNPDCFCENKENQDLSLEQYNNNQKHKEYLDTGSLITDHGTRMLHAGQIKRPEFLAGNNYPIANDEFALNQDTTNFTYSFAVTGPNNTPELIMGQNGRINLRNPRVNSFGIKDIEIKLNFLNYVNTKNLVVWLEVDFCGAEGSAKFVPVERGFPKPPIRSKKEFIDQSYEPTIISGSWSPGLEAAISGSLNNAILENYIKNITMMNSSEFGQPFKLYLLNQETIQNNNYNFSVKFSDSASKYNVLYDTNINRDSFDNNKVPGICINQKTIRDNDEILPTLAASGYSDREACYYANILRLNKLNITNNSLSKFFSTALLQNAGPTRGPCPENGPKQQGGDYGGSTKFTLKMMVLDEADDMTLNDNVITSNFLSGLETADNKVKSSNIYNSLCNWELILHVGDVHKPVPYSRPSLESYGNVDALSLLEYGNNPKYPGYSFMADLTNYTHLLPVANLNAPYSCIADTNLCLTTQNDPTGQGVMIQTTPFPHWAILSILTGLAAYAGSTGGTLVGALGGLEGAVNNPGYTSLINWFAETAFIQGMVDAGRQVYFPNFSKYNFGSPEKMLINFRKQDSAWYAAEASIFRYHNTPILKQNTYQFRKLTQNTNNQRLSRFQFTVVDDYTSLIDSTYIKTTKLPPDTTIASIFNSRPPIQVPGALLYAGDLVDITVEENDGLSTYRYVVSPVESVRDNHDEIVDGSYGVYIAKLNDDNNTYNLSLENINYAFNYLQNNSILSANNTFFDNTLETSISDKKVILIDSRIPYDILRVSDHVDMISGDTSNVNKILKKALIFKNNRYQSALVLEKSVEEATELSPSESCNVFLVYKNETTIEDEVAKKYNMWAFDYNKTFRHKTVPEISANTHSVGSYGDLSIFVKKNLLTENIYLNKLEALPDILNNSVNDKIKYNKVNFIINNNTISFDNRPICGFTYSETDLVPSVFDLVDNCVIVKPEQNILSDTDDERAIDEQLAYQIKLSTTNSNEIPNGRFCIIRVGDANSEPISLFAGDLQLENDYIEHIPIKVLAKTDIDKLSARLKVIDSTKEDTSLESAIGSRVGAVILSSSNLFYLYKHLEALEDDPILCQSSSSTNTSDCVKLKTQQRINELLVERADILNLLDYQAIRYETVRGDSIEVSYSGRSSLPDSDPRKLYDFILPKIDINIEYGNNYTKINYVPGNINHYWINLDPNQSCIFDFSANPKILLETKYSCIPTNPFVSNPRIDPFNHNICPQFLKKINTDEINSVETVKVGDKFFGNTLASSYTYKIPEPTVESQKNRLQQTYPAITGWRTFNKERYFNINGDETNDKYPNDETTIASEEKYLVPLFRQSGGGAIDLSGDMTSLPGIPKCQTDEASQGGFGLLKEDGSRNGTSTKIKNVVNLDNANSIEVMVKRIPRMLRGVDLLSTIYRYGAKNIYRQLNSSSPAIPYEIDSIGMQGTLNSSLYCWICLQVEPGGEKIKYTDTPDFFRLQNEMIFRSFYGSVDKIENKTDNLVSLFPWEMIPYEYGTK